MFSSGGIAKAKVWLERNFVRPGEKLKL